MRSHWVAQSKAEVSEAWKEVKVPPYFGFSTTVAEDVTGGTAVVFVEVVVAGALDFVEVPQETRSKLIIMEVTRIVHTVLFIIYIYT
jgi:hypothetical protein